MIFDKYSAIPVLQEDDDMETPEEDIESDEDSDSDDASDDIEEDDGTWDEEDR